jgi:hypothetical protein
MAKNPTLEEIRAMLDRGELPVLPGTTMADLQRSAEEKFARIVADLMGVPVERITARIIEDVGTPGKIGLQMDFDPELTPAEQPIYEAAMQVAAGLLGSRPPFRMAKAGDA